MIFKTGNGIISPTFRPMIKQLFLQKFSPFTKEFNIDFQNRNQNYLNRKWNYFFHFQAFDQKTTFTKIFSFPPRSSKLIFKTGNGIIQTRNGIIFPTSRPLIKKASFTKAFIFSQRIKNDFIDRKWYYPNKKWNYPTHFHPFNRKTSFTKCF